MRRRTTKREQNNTSHRKKQRSTFTTQSIRGTIPPDETFGLPKVGDEEPSKQKKRPLSFIARGVNSWADRVLGAMKDGDFDGDEQYESHRTTKDFKWNTLGSAAWSFVFPVVTMVSTQIVGVERAGMISMAFVIGLLLMFVGNFGTRAYQASDINEQHTFIDYQVSRWVTCAIMLLLGWWYAKFRGYSGEMMDITTAVLIYRMIDALADVYEGRLQQVDKLYLGGVSQFVRSASAIVAFSLTLLISQNPSAACWAMAIVAILTFVVVTLPLTLLETPSSKGFNPSSVIELLKVTAPLFIAIFLFNVIENMPKLVMEGSLSYDSQLFFNALYFPAQMILIIGQLVYKPLIVKMAGVWQDETKRRKFDFLMLGIFAVIVMVTAGAWAIMAAIGIPVMSFLYGVDFEEYRYLSYVMIVTGGITAAIDFVYQVITVMRRQRDVTTLYCVTFGFALFIPTLLISFEGLNGAILSYLIIEAILFVLLLWEYFRIRGDLSREAQIRKEAEASARAQFFNEMKQ